MNQGIIIKFMLIAAVETKLHYRNSMINAHISNSKMVFLLILYQKPKLDKASLVW